MIGNNWMIRMDDDCFPNKATHRPDDMGELFGNGSVGDLIWFINKGHVLAVATFASATPTEVSYKKFYDISDCELYPTCHKLDTTVSSYYETKTWSWGAYVEYTSICRYRKITV